MPTEQPAPDAWVYPVESLRLQVPSSLHPSEPYHTWEEIPQGVRSALRYVGEFHSPTGTTRFWCANYFDGNGLPTDFMGVILDVSRMVQGIIVERRLVFVEKLIASTSLPWMLMPWRDKPAAAQAEKGGAA